MYKFGIEFVFLVRNFKKQFMKQVLTIFTGCLLTIFSMAQQQTNLVFFSEQGEQFLVVLNGVQQNFNPQTNVKVTNLIQPYYKVKIRFVDGRTPDIDKTINFNAGTETTFIVKKTKKENYVLRWLSEVPIMQAPQNVANQNIVVFSTMPPVDPALNGTVNNTTTTAVHSETIAPSQQSGNVSMGVNINDPELGVNMNINVNASETGMHTQNNTTTYSQTTTTYSTGSTGGQIQRPGVNGYTGTVGCAWPMDATSFSNAYASIQSKDFEDSKLTIAKQVIKNNCLSSDQVKQIMLLFDFESTRLELAKFAYGYTYDIGNYYLLNDAFDFESSIDELNSYIEGYQR